MGAQQSNAQKVASSTQALDRAYREVVLVSNAVVTQAVRDGWSANDANAVCQRIVLTERNTLDWLDLQRVAGVQGRVGIALAPPFDITATQEANARRRVCALAADYFTAKVRLATYIRLNIRALCHDARDEIARNMPDMLQGASQQQESQAYARLDRLDGILLSWYQGVVALLEILDGDIDVERLRNVDADVRRLITSRYSQCCRAVHDLREFAWEPLPQPGPGGLPQFVNRYLPGEPVVTGVLPRIAVTGLCGPPNRAPSRAAARSTLRGSTCPKAFLPANVGPVGPGFGGGGF